MIKKCQVFTPYDVADMLLDVVEYKENLLGKKIIENACGDGNILKIVVDRYIKDCLVNKFSIEKIKLGLENDIYGIEIDEYHYQSCIGNLDSIASRYGIHNVSWKILRSCIQPQNMVKLIYRRP